MLTYALGRGLEYYDMPAVRKIVAMTQVHATTGSRPSFSAWRGACRSR
jgi:hypothetical protein